MSAVPSTTINGFPGSVPTLAPGLPEKHMLKEKWVCRRSVGGFLERMKWIGNGRREEGEEGGGREGREGRKGREASGPERRSDTVEERGGVDG